MKTYLLKTIILKRFTFSVLFLSVSFLHMTGENIIKDSLYVKSQKKTVYYNSDLLFSDYARDGYASVIGDLYEYYEDVFWNMPEESKQQEIQKMRDIAKAFNSDSLSLEAYFIEALCLPQDTKDKVVYKIDELQDIVYRAKKENNLSMKLRSMDAIIGLCWQNKEYAKSFSQIQLMEKELEKADIQNCPDKARFCFEIGQAYFFFRDYDKSIPYLRKAMTPSSHYCDRADLKARNTIGLYYNIKGEVDSAEYYFRSAYNSYDKVKSRSKYDALSLSNLGHCLVKRKNYNEAISYFKAGLTRILEDNDYKMASEITVGLGLCYCEQNNMRKAKHMIDSSLIYIKKSDNVHLYRNLYPLMSKYYIKTGNKKLAEAYVDSTTVSTMRFMEEYSSLNILRAEQALFEMEKTAKDDELKYNAKVYNDRVFYGILIICFMFLCLLIFVVLYRKNKMAYKALVLKNQDWAEAKTTFEEQDGDTDALSDNNDVVNDTDPGEEDMELMKQVNELIKKDKKFKDLDLSLDSLSKEININRNYLSKAINKTTGKNFNTYINEFRIKEAIKIMSDEKSDLISIDAIALEVGFSNRISFYQSFKKITGLTPSDFRNNKAKAI